jgi:hypothetical protein
MATAFDLFYPLDDDCVGFGHRSTVGSGARTREIRYAKLP